MKEFIFKEPKPIEFFGQHLPIDCNCGCFPCDIYRQEVGFVVTKRGERAPLIDEFRVCLN